MVKKLKNLIRQAIITLITDDSEKYPLMQINYNGKTANAIRVSPYGLCSNPVSGMLSLTLNSCGNESQKFGIPIDVIKRFKDLEEGEAALYNSESKSYVFLKANGDIVLSGNNIELNGNSDSAVAYTDMKAAFDQLKTDLNILATNYNSHTHQGQVAIVSIQISPSIADMSSAEVPTVKVP